MKETHLIPGGIPAQELVDRVMETYDNRLGIEKRRFWAIRERIVYWGAVPAGVGGAPGRVNPDAEAVLVWADGRTGGDTVATLEMSITSDLVTAVAIDGDTGYSSVRDLLTVLRQLDLPPPHVEDDDQGPFVANPTPEEV